MTRLLFNVAYQRRLAAINGSWLGAWGPEAALWDALVFSKVRRGVTLTQPFCKAGKQAGGQVIPVRLEGRKLGRREDGNVGRWEGRRVGR